MRTGKINGRNYGTMSIDAETSVYIQAEDVIQFIEDYATQSDLEQIVGSLNIDKAKIKTVPTDTIYDQLKVDLLQQAAEKYTLIELQNLLKL